MSTLANSEPALTFLIACCAKATILLACAWITVIALRQRSSALRHHVWAAAILASLALPFFAPRSPPLTPNGREKCYTRSIWRPAMTSSDDVIVKDPQIMGGAPVFRGTRVPLQALFDYLEGGETLEEFLDGYPSVSREMAIRALEEAKQLLSARI